ncbi:MAG: hypothetical protein IJ105_04675 [Bacilli bacterium]|nr:hypothetical protein [Bacilli bacterium]
MKFKKEKVNYDELVKYTIYVCLNNNFDSIKEYYDHIDYLKKIEEKTKNKNTIIKIKKGIELINQKIKEEKFKLYKPYNLKNIQ